MCIYCDLITTKLNYNTPFCCRRLFIKCAVLPPLCYWPQSGEIKLCCTTSIWRIKHYAIYRCDTPQGTNSLFLLLYDILIRCISPKTLWKLPRLIITQPRYNVSFSLTETALTRPETTNRKKNLSHSRSFPVGIHGPRLNWNVLIKQSGNISEIRYLF